MPRPSQIKCRLEPSFARSVGLGPVFCPQKLLLSNCRPPPHETNQFFLNGRANPTPQSGSIARFLLPASPVSDASKSYQNHIPVPAAASPKECRCATQTRFRPNMFCLPDAASRPLASASRQG